MIISNCVINLAPDKARVFQEACRVLKPTGRLLISDIVTESELPDAVKQSVEAWAGCVSGALEKSLYLNTIKQAGFNNIEIVSQSTFDIDFSPDFQGQATSIQVAATKAS